MLHFAALALVAESVEHPERYYRGNFVGTLNLLDAMREHGVKRLVFSSTCATYGEPDEVPIHESTGRPVNPYGYSKLAVDRMIGDECRAHGLGAVSLRYFNVAGADPARRGPRPRDALIPLVLQAAAGAREHVSVFGTDYPTRTAPASATTSTSRTSAERTSSRSNATGRAATSIYNLGNGLGFSCAR